MAKYTPMMEQYLKIKESYKDCLLFFRLGDFYELFFDDALKASEELDITLTGKDCGQSERAPMCGVPFHSADGYIAKLIEKGYKVAICEQTEDPKKTKTLVKREVIRVITPGTVLDSNLLDDGKNNFIMCIYENKNGFGISVADVSTGEFLTTEFATEQSNKIIDEIAKYNPAEIITNKNLNICADINKIFNIKTNIYNDWAFEYQNANITLCNHFKVLNLSGFGIENEKLAVSSSGALIQYLIETQKNNLSHISSIKKYYSDKYMVLDLSSRRNLELTQTIRYNNKKGSLLWVLDKTNTSMGARLLRKWIEQPLVDVEQIKRRLDSVEKIKNDMVSREELKELLNTIHDIERLMGRVIYATANARDLNSLKKSFENLPHIKSILKSFDSSLIKQIYNNIDTLEDIYTIINDSISEEAPFSIREGKIIKDGFNAEVDKLRTAKKEGNKWLSDIENAEKEKTGIKNLKIRFNKVFGYYIEVTNSYLNLVPETYIRKQTLSNCERFITPELKKIEETILGADEKVVELEYNIFSDIRNKIADEVQRIQKTAHYISVIDVFCSLAEVAEKQNYIKPEINDSGEINIINGRHPVVEKTIEGDFISNDTILNTDSERLAIITGPNMSGKSTYMRQVALIVLMSQVGSFVPAEKACIGITDRIFTRVGASDDLATGQSTFMVEMTEVANILNNATNKSLLILDEIGRGTSTYDGLSIAWAVLEYIADKSIIGARTLFATHYHEITQLEGKIEGVNNYCVCVKEEGEDIIFLRKIIKGHADRSYGIHVAKLAGFPEKVLNRANEVLELLAGLYEEVENEEDGYYTQKKLPKEAIFFNDLNDEISKLDINKLSPMEALKKLFEIKEKLSRL